MPKYPRAQSFDIVRNIKSIQSDVKTLQVQSAAKVRQSLNQSTAALNSNPYYWGLDTTGWQASAGSIVAASDPPAGAPYPYASLYTNDTTGQGALLNTGGAFIATYPLSYQVSAYVNSTAATVQIGLDFQDTTHSFLAGPTNPTVTVIPGTWTQIQATVQAPIGAGFAYPRVGSPSGDGAMTYVQATQVVPVGIVPGPWQDMRPLSNSFVGTISGSYPPQYRMYGDSVEVAGYIKTPPTTGNYNSVTFFTMPTAYRPNSNNGQGWLVSAVADGAATPKLSVLTSGAVQLNFLPTSLAQTQIGIMGRYPLDASGLILT